MNGDFIESNITVSGNIIGELSEKIPNYVVALNELIKNSYDAGAKHVTISFNKELKKLVICDDGEGMDENDIKMLFHISSSNKIYGKINKYQRYTQGSKGLGFLAVFKFGKKICWRTKKSTGYMFSIDYDELHQSKNLPSMIIKLYKDDRIKKGTTIEMELGNNTEYLSKYFSDESNFKKILNAFDDDKFTINLIVEDNCYTSDEPDSFYAQSPDSQLFTVHYDSINQNIEYQYNDRVILSIPFKFNSKKFSISIDLVIFQFKSYGRSKIDKLYTNLNGDLTPLIYINSNLFNNYDLFDPNIMKNIKTSSVLNQMIGKIKIYDVEDLEFNSDRTHFVQNDVSDSITNFLREINKKIQESGSRYKKYLMEFDFLKVDEIPYESDHSKNDGELRKYIKEDFEFKDKVEIHIDHGCVIYSLFGKDKKVPIQKKQSNPVGDNITTPRKIGPGKIFPHSPDPVEVNLKKLPIMPVPSPQIDLKRLICSATDSYGTDILPEDFKILIDGMESNGILPSISNTCTKQIKYIFNDSQTGESVTILDINFKKFNTKKKTSAKQLISKLTNNEYDDTQYDCTVKTLVAQINSLDRKNYREVIACSLRSILEISIDNIIKDSKHKQLSNDLENLDLSNKLKKILEYASNKKILEQMSKNSGINYKSMRDMIKSYDVEVLASIANLGAHKSSECISIEHIEHLGLFVSLFIVIVNELIDCDNDVWSKL